MPRPKKWRKVCCMPKNDMFQPINRKCMDIITMTVDEYETVRLIDYMGFTQEECGKYMNVARTTVQQIYNNARRKIASALVEGKGLSISGGDFVLCDGKEQFCDCGGCEKHKYNSDKQETERNDY